VFFSKRISRSERGLKFIMKKIYVLALTLFILLTGCHKIDNEYTDDLSKYMSWYVLDFTSGVNKINDEYFINLYIARENEECRRITYNASKGTYIIENSKPDSIGKNLLKLSEVIDIYDNCYNYLIEHVKITNYYITISTSPKHYKFHEKDNIFIVSDKGVIEKYQGEEFTGYLAIIHAEDNVYQFCIGIQDNSDFKS